MTTLTHGRRRFLAGVAVLSVVLAACSGSASPSAVPASPTPIPPSTSPAPAQTDPDPGFTGHGGGSAGDPGTGIGAPPIDPTPIDPGANQPTLVRPVPGRMNPHPVAPISIQTSIDGRHVLVKLTWYGGVEPCSVLDSVKVERTGNEIALTPIEGSSDATAVCIDLAMLKATIVDLGDLEPGVYRLNAPGSELPPVEITIA